MWKEIGHVGKTDYAMSYLLIQKTKQRFVETFDFYPTAAQEEVILYKIHFAVSFCRLFFFFFPRFLIPNKLKKPLVFPLSPPAPQK